MTAKKRAPIREKNDTHLFTHICNSHCNTSTQAQRKRQKYENLKETNPLAVAEMKAERAKQRRDQMAREAAAKAEAAGEEPRMKKLREREDHFCFN